MILQRTLGISEVIKLDFKPSYNRKLVGDLYDFGIEKFNLDRESKEAKIES